MPISLGSLEGDTLRSTETDYGSPPFNPDTIMATQIQSYADTNITALVGAKAAWVVLAKFTLWLYRRTKKLEARISVLEKR